MVVVVAVHIAVLDHNALLAEHSHSADLAEEVSRYNIYQQIFRGMSHTMLTNIRHDLGDCWHHIVRIGHPAAHAGIHHVVAARRNSLSAVDQIPEVLHRIVELEVGSPVVRTLADHNPVEAEVDIVGRNLEGIGCMDRTW